MYEKGNHVGKFIGVTEYEFRLIDDSIAGVFHSFKIRMCASESSSSLESNELFASSSSSSSSFSSSSSLSPLSVKLFKKNSKTKLSKKLLIEKCHINNISKKPYKIIVPRLIESDIRKQYPIMFINVLNSSNIDALSFFMYKYTHRGCTYQSICRAANTRIKESFMIDNIHQLVTFYDTLHHIVPDHTYHLLSAEVKTRSDTFTSMIYIDFQINGTKMYDLTPSSAHDIALSSSVCKSSSNSSLSLTCEDSVATSSSSPREDRSASFGGILSKEAYCAPRPLKLEGRLTLVVEDPRQYNARISSIFSDVKVICD